MRRVLTAAFGAHAQVVMGLLLLLLAAVETILWWHATVHQVFIVSMEALFFAAYAIMATGFAVLWLDKRTPGGDESG